MNTQPRPFGKYFLLEKIATGGMAEIYKAKTFGTDGFEKIVVIKKILAHWASDPDFVRMLIDEAKLSVLLNHANIVGVFDLGSVENDYFIAMEFIEGYDLKTLMNRVKDKGKTIPPDVAAFIAMQVAAGLEHAHKKTGADGKSLGIIHRDISPHNILLSMSGDVKITDFGIAKATMKKSFTSTGMLKGKFSYMSPEQVRGETLTPQSDLFSLGVVLYEILTGQKCFEGDTEVAIIDKIRNAQIKAENLPATIPDSLRKILSKALAVKLDERYLTADQIQTDLAHALAEIHPGFLPKDLSKFLGEFPGSGALGGSEASASPALSQPSISQNAETNVSYIPGFKAATHPGVPKKSSMVWVWVLLFLFVGFTALAGGGYAAWVYVIQPRLAARLTPPPQISLPTPPPIPTPPVIPTLPPVETQPAVPPQAALPTSLPSTMPATPPETQAAIPNMAMTQPAPESGPQTQPSAQQAALGQAYVNSTPDGADIYLDDAPTGGRTPALISNLKLGQSYRIRLMKPGYLALEAVYTPNSTEPQRLELPLRELPKGMKAPSMAQAPGDKEPPPPPRKRRARSYDDAPSGQPLRQTPPPPSPGSSGVMIYR